MMTKRKLTTALALMVAVLTSAQVRVVESLNFGWRFHAGDVKGAEQTAFDDAQWRVVTVPHDFQIEQPWVAPAADEKADNTDVAANIKSRLSSRGFKEMGKGWYRLHLTPADSLKGRRLLLQFDGIMYTGDVYLNGQRIGGRSHPRLFNLEVVRHGDVSPFTVGRPHLLGPLHVAGVEAPAEVQVLNHAHLCARQHGHHQGQCSRQFSLCHHSLFN